MKLVRKSSHVEKAYIDTVPVTGHPLDWSENVHFQCKLSWIFRLPPGLVCASQFIQNDRLIMSEKLDVEKREKLTMEGSKRFDRSQV